MEHVSKVIEGQKSFDLFVWFDEASRRDTQAMRGVLIDGHKDFKIPLSQVAEVALKTAPLYQPRTGTTANCGSSQCCWS
jgi:Cu/Ag efflux pump CusA